MSYQDNITVSVNRALKSKLLRESKAVSKKAANNQRSNVQFTNKRRHAEDIALAKELGCTVKELTE